MNGCEFCGDQQAEYWVEINAISRLFCSEEHSKRFNNIMKTLKFQAGWSTVDMLISKESSQGWICKAFRGMIELEFKILFDEYNEVKEFKPL